MNFLKDNIIFIFGVLSLVSIIFAASGLAKNSEVLTQTPADHQENAGAVNPPSKDTPKISGKAEIGQKVLASESEEHETGLGAEGFDD